MKKFLFIISIISILLIVLFSNVSKSDENNQILRFHVRANSNSSFDQYVKYDVKDKVVSMLSSTLKNAKSYNQAYEFLDSATLVIEEYTNFLLKKYNCNYKAKVNLQKEYFDKKVEDNFVINAGVYDALVICLGEAKGNNWWCLVYPSLSFVPTGDEVDYDNIIYKSKLMELYNKTIN